MYVCLDCNKLFDSPKKYVETHGLDTPPYETWTGCPSCGGSYVSATECDECGDYVCTATYVEIGTKCYCENCYELHDVDDLAC